jgi:hypothetical protein
VYELQVYPGDDSNNSKKQNKMIRGVFDSGGNNEVCFGVITSSQLPLITKAHQEQGAHISACSTDEKVKSNNASTTETSNEYLIPLRFFPQIKLSSLLYLQTR